MKINFSSFIDPSKFATNNLYYCDGCGIIDDNTFKIDRNKFRNSLFVYVDRGVFHVIQNKHYKVKQGNCILMRLTDKHKYYNDSKIGAKIYWMHFSDKTDQKLLSFIQKNKGLPYMFTSDVVSNNIVNAIENRKKDSKNHEIVDSLVIYENLLTISNMINKEKNKYEFSLNEFENRAEEYVIKNISNKPNLEEFASFMGYSKYHFCRIFKKRMDITPIKYFYYKKIIKSKPLLSYTRDSISNIALSFGFDSGSHFSRVFKDFEEITPLKYRKLGK